PCELRGAVHQRAIFMPGWLEMIGHQDDQVGGAAAFYGPPEELPGAPQRITAQPGQRPGKFSKNPWGLCTPRTVRHSTRDVRGSCRGDGAESQSARTPSRWVARRHR